MEQIRLDLVPKFVPSVCHVSQYDDGRVVRCYLSDDGADYFIVSGDEITLYVRKGDGHFVTAECSCTVGNNYVDFVTTEQMTAVSGDNEAELKIVNGDKTIGTANFIINVEKDPTDGSEASASEIANLQAMVEEALDDTNINDLGDVNITSPSDGEVLKYDEESGKWINGEGGGSGGLPALPTTAGLYCLKVDIVNGAPVYSWVIMDPIYTRNISFIETINEPLVNYTIEIDED